MRGWNAGLECGAPGRGLDEPAGIVSRSTRLYGIQDRSVSSGRRTPPGPGWPGELGGWTPEGRPQGIAFLGAATGPRHRPEAPRAGGKSRVGCLPRSTTLASLQVHDGPGRSIIHNYFSLSANEGPTTGPAPDRTRWLAYSYWG